MDQIKSFFQDSSMTIKIHEIIFSARLDERAINLMKYKLLQVIPVVAYIR